MNSNSDSLTLNDIHKICENYFKQRSTNSVIIVKSHKFSLASAEPIGFLAHHSVLNVTVFLKSLDRCEDLIFFVKSLPKFVSEHTDYVESFHTFEKEIVLYESLIPPALNVSSIKFAANCYLIKKNDLLVFEHLTQSGYSLVQRNDGLLDFNHLLVALRTIAAMHASSIVLEKTNAELIKEMCKNGLFENAYPSHVATKRVDAVENGIRALCQLIKYIPKYANNFDVIIPKFVQEMRKIFEFCKSSSNFRNVFSHGDLWSNNVMYRYADTIDENQRTDKLPVDAVLVDFQLSRWAPPAYDLMTFITLTTNSDFREKHYQQLIDAYYRYLGSELKQHDIDVTTEISVNEWTESCKYYKLAGLIEANLFGHLTLLPSNMSCGILTDSVAFEEFISVSRAKICSEAFHVNENYRHRLTDSLGQIIDLFVLKK